MKGEFSVVRRFFNLVQFYHSLVQIQKNKNKNKNKKSLLVKQN